jgi:hypothetical protein
VDTQRTNHEELMAAMTKRENHMKAVKVICAVMVAIVLSGISAWSAEGVISKATTSVPGYCNLKFQRIQEETLFWDRPVLESDGSKTIDFYGPCDHDPLGRAEILRQRRALLRRENRNAGRD